MIALKSLRKLFVLPVGACPEDIFGLGAVASHDGSQLLLTVLTSLDHCQKWPGVCCIHQTHATAVATSESIKRDAGQLEVLFFPNKISNDEIIRGHSEVAGTGPDLTFGDVKGS